MKINLNISLITAHLSGLNVKAPRLFTFFIYLSSSTDAYITYDKLTDFKVFNLKNLRCCATTQIIKQNMTIPSKISFMPFQSIYFCPIHPLVTTDLFTITVA